MAEIYHESPHIVDDQCLCGCDICTPEEGGCICPDCRDCEIPGSPAKSPIWRVTFKSHSMGVRMYHIDSTDQTSAYFAMLALEQRNWFVVGIEELEDDDV